MRSWGHVRISVQEARPLKVIGLWNDPWHHVLCSVKAQASFRTSPTKSERFSKFPVSTKPHRVFLVRVRSSVNWTECGPRSRVIIPTIIPIHTSFRTRFRHKPRQTIGTKNPMEIPTRRDPGHHVGSKIRDSMPTPCRIRIRGTASMMPTQFTQPKKGTKGVLFSWT